MPEDENEIEDESVECSNCGNPIPITAEVVEDDKGDVYCRECAEKIGLE